MARLMLNVDRGLHDLHGFADRQPRPREQAMDEAFDKEQSGLAVRIRYPCRDRYRRSVVVGRVGNVSRFRISGEGIPQPPTPATCIDDVTDIGLAAVRYYVQINFEQCCSAISAGEANP